MEPTLQIRLNPIYKAVWLPVVSPIGDGHCLSKVVQLKATASHSIHDGCIVNHLIADAQIDSSDKEVGVSSGSIDGNVVVSKVSVL